MRIFITVFLLFLSLPVFGQAFEGRITYQISYKSKIPNVTDAQLASMMGTTQQYYIKGGSYRSDFDGVLMQWQLYVASENRLYTKMSNSESILWNDAGVNNDDILDLKVNKDAAEILGHVCDEAVYLTKGGTNRYYFSRNFGVDVQAFARHNFGNWYELLKATRALPLKAVTETQQFVITSVATEIVAAKLTQKEFALPANAKTVKNPH